MMLVSDFSTERLPETITVQIPRTLMPLPANRVDRLTAVPFSTDRGTGALFARWLLDITARASEFTPADGPTLSSVTVDLLAAVLATSMDALLPESRRRVLRLQVYGLRRLPVRSIAARWGFADQAHFSRAFRTAYGVTPSEHRQHTPAARESANGLRGQTMPEGPRARHPDDANRRPEGHAR